MSQLHIDQKAVLGIRARDVAGNVVPFTPDAPPTWSGNNPLAATEEVSADGLTDTLTPVTVGLTTDLLVEVLIGGQKFSATISENVVEGAVASVEITETFIPKV